VKRQLRAGDLDKFGTVQLKLDSVRRLAAEFPRKSTSRNTMPHMTASKKKKKEKETLPH
jgi:hypothetical protein